MQYHKLENEQFPHFIEVDKIQNFYQPMWSTYKMVNFSYVEDFRGSVIRQDIYEWLLDHIGPSEDMIWDSDRIFFNKNDCPEIKFTKKEWLADRTFVFDNPNKWLLYKSTLYKNKSLIEVPGLSFKKEDSAMLFKLTWG